VSAKPQKAPKPSAFLKVITKGKPSTSTIRDTLAFYLDDFPRTLFPLKTNLELIKRGEAEIKEYVAKCLDTSNLSYSFLPQLRVYATKPRLHLRRTVKLDPVAEYYIYDVIYRNKSLFRKPHSPGRTHYGYRFESGTPITSTAAYTAFKTALADYNKRFVHSMSFDVASYFNGVYHHDIVSWFSELGATDTGAEGLGQFLRQIRSGRSVDCLPQGLYPAKMIGNDFLRFIDNFHELKSDEFVRFMDDMYIFSNDESAIAGDFQVIQRLLGERGLSVNPQKARKGTASHVKIDSDIDAVKKKLLKRRRSLVTEGYDDAGNEVVKERLHKWPLSDKELEYIDAILEQPDIEEEDAELILTIMGDHAIRVEKRLPYIIRSYPNLIKSVYSFCARVRDKEVVADILLDEANEQGRLMEFQLFWFAAILEEYLMDTSKASTLISILFNHRSATSITKAKILEIADVRFGLPDLRNEFLVSGQSDWLAWSSAVGSRALKPISRNHRLKYFGNSSNMNHLVATIMSKA
jgi:hypothetical protein